MLTPQQLACLRKAAEFKSSKIIAHEMNITSKTVDRHIEAANRTLGVGSRQQAIRVLLESDRVVGGLSPGGIFRIDREVVFPTFPERHIESARLREPDDRAPYDPSPPPKLLEEQRSAADHDLTMQLKTVALIALIAASLVFLIAEYPSLIRAAEFLAEAITSHHSH